MTNQRKANFERRFDVPNTLHIRPMSATIVKALVSVVDYE